MLWARRRIARSFHRLSRRDGSSDKGAAGAASVGHAFTRRLPASHNCSKRFLLKNFGGQGPVAKSWLGCCRLAAERCPQRGRRNRTPLGQRSRVDGSFMETHFWSTLACPVLGRQSQVHQALGQTALQRHVRGLLRSRRIGGFVLYRRTEFLQRASTAGCLCSFPSGSGPPAQRPRDHRAHNFLSKPACERDWVLASPSRRTADNLRALHLWRPSPFPGG